GQNYGEAGAIDWFGPRYGLPKAVSAHQNYFLWGPRNYDGSVAIVLADDRETLEKIFGSVELAAHVQHPYSMPYEHFDVWVCRGMREPLAQVWPRLKKYH
ncbi:MAG TPA: glycosyltransferase, partial [Thermoanaerobaculia bacterium]